MRRSITTLLLCLSTTLGLPAAHAQASDPLQERARGWIGSVLDNRVRFGEVVPGTGGCRDRGGGALTAQRDIDERYGRFYLECEDRRWVAVLTEVDPVLSQLSYIRAPVVRVADVLVLPPMVDGLQVFDTVSYLCTRPRGVPAWATVIVVGRYGKRRTITDRSGIESAWLPNTGSGRIEPLSIRGMKCERPVPD